MNKQIMKDLRHTSLTLSYAYGAVFVVCMFAGCGPDNPLDRQAISGMVTFDGKPLPHGSISFEPSQSGGVTSGATVTNGQYDIVAHKGLPSGRYLVRINASMSDSKAIAALPPGTPEPPGIELIPPSYNVDSQHFVEVGQNGNQFDFDVSTE